MDIEQKINLIGAECQHASDKLIRAAKAVDQAVIWLTEAQAHLAVARKASGIEPEDYPTGWTL
jgi:hypothetical protein